jgi:hypothetical protein
MEKTGPVRQAVERNEIVVACAYEGWVTDDVKAALPRGFKSRSYVAKFVDGRLVGLAQGMPEEAILELLEAENAEPAVSG